MSAVSLSTPEKPTTKPITKPQRTQNKIKNQHSDFDARPLKSKYF